MSGREVTRSVFLGRLRGTVQGEVSGSFFLGRDCPGGSCPAENCPHEGYYPRGTICMGSVIRGGTVRVETVSGYLPVTETNV